MAARLAGLVKSWFPESDYGFIEAEEVEYFCHASRLQNCYALAPSDQVRFTPESSKKRTGKLEASQVYLMQRGSTAKASSAGPAATLECTTVVPGKSSNNVASRAMRPWCKVPQAALPLRAEEKPFPQPGSDDETEQSPANSIVASSSSSAFSSLSVGEVEEQTLAETAMSEAEIEKEKVEVVTQQVEKVTAQQVGQVMEEVHVGEVAAQHPTEEVVEEVADDQVVEEVTAPEVEEFAEKEEVVEEKRQKRFLGYTPPRCWPARKCEEKTEKKELEPSKHLATQPPMQPTAEKPAVAGCVTETGPERATTKSAPEPSAPAGQEVGKVGSGASEVVRRAGLVTHWYAVSNYGFINDGRCEYFCHASQLKNCVTLASSDQVRFTGVPSEKRPGKKEAREVYLIKRGTSSS